LRPSRSLFTPTSRESYRRKIEELERLMADPEMGPEAMGHVRKMPVSHWRVLGSAVAAPVTNTSGPWDGGRCVLVSRAKIGRVRALTVPQWSGFRPDRLPLWGSIEARAFYASSVAAPIAPTGQKLRQAGGARCSLALGMDAEHSCQGPRSRSSRAGRQCGREPPVESTTTPATTAGDGACRRGESARMS
jgi:hypothetical protein